MPAITKNPYSQEQHPWDWYIPNGATKLLIGTFPTDARNRKHDFFYCSSTNRFWEVLAAIAGYPNLSHNRVAVIEERKKVLGGLRLGLTDIGKIIYTQQGTSKDHSLFPIEFTDIFQILNDHPAIQLLIVSGDTQGNSSLSWFNIYCSLNNVKINIRQLKKEKTTEIIVSGRKIQLLLGYSTSRSSRVTTETLIENYRSIIRELQLNLNQKI